MVRILFDTGATGSFVEAKLVKNLRVKTTRKSPWNTGNGTMHTNRITTTNLILPELYHERVITYQFHVIDSLAGYDMIIGTDLMTEIGLNIDMKRQEIRWDDAAVPFKSRDATIETAYHIEDSDSLKESVR